MPEQWLSDTARTATIVICLIIFLLSLWAAIKRYTAHRKQSPVPDWIRITPGVVISLGVFGTFLGIFLGLLSFDTTDIDSSIPNLLDGLKTAFITSLVGMFFSILLKYIFGYFDTRDSREETPASEDPVVYLRQLSAATNHMSTKMTEVGDTLISCFKSDEEYSLLSQLKLIRTEMTDLRRDISHSLEEFSKKVAQLGTEALIEALREVIDQFNARLSDLVGAEFKQLRDAMVELNTWQREYRSLIEKLHEQIATASIALEKSAASIDRASNSLEETDSHLDSIDGSLSTMSASVEDIAQHIEYLKVQNQQLKNFLEQIQILGEEAKTVLPRMSTHINDSCQTLVKASEDAKQQFADIGVAMELSVEATNKQLTELQESQIEQHQKVLTRLNEELASTLNGSLSSLGSQLAALSQKFASDYGPLTDRLREIVRIAEGTDGGNSA